MKLFCPHVQDMLRPLAPQGSADAFFMMLRRCASLALGEMHSGRLGVCLLDTLKGDVVVALFGGRAPFVLRPHPIDEKVQRWTFVGGCYFHEFMDGKHVSALMKEGLPSELFGLRQTHYGTSTFNDA